MAGWAPVSGLGATLALDHAEDVLLAHDEVLLAVDLDLGARVLRKEDAVPGLDVQRADLAVLQDLAVSDGDHLALDRLLLGRIGDDDAALRLLLLLDALHDDAVLQRPDLHVDFLLLSREPPWRTARSVRSGCLALGCSDCQRRAYGNHRPPRVKRPLWSGRYACRN